MILSAYVRHLTNVYTYSIRITRHIGSPGIIQFQVLTVFAGTGRREVIKVEFVAIKHKSLFIGSNRDVLWTDGFERDVR